MCVDRCERDRQVRDAKINNAKCERHDDDQRTKWSRNYVRERVLSPTLLSHARSSDAAHVISYLSSFPPSPTAFTVERNGLRPPPPPPSISLDDSRSKTLRFECIHKHSTITYNTHFNVF